MIGRLPLYGDDSRELRRALFSPRDPVKTAILHFNRRRATRFWRFSRGQLARLKMHLILQLDKEFIMKRATAVDFAFVEL